MCVVVLLVVAYVVVPLVANEYWLQAILIPFLISSLAALGLNLLTGYAGQVSLGTGGFMAVGAYTAYKMTTAFPELNILLIFLLSGLVAAAIGLVFGIPSLRIKGLYLAWLPWRRNSSSCGSSTVWRGSTTTTLPALLQPHPEHSWASW